MGAEVVGGEGREVSDRLARDEGEAVGRGHAEGEVSDSGRVRRLDGQAVSDSKEQVSVEAHSQELRVKSRRARASTPASFCRFAARICSLGGGAQSAQDGLFRLRVLPFFAVHLSTSSRASSQK